MSTTRLSLIKEGEIVILLNYGEEVAFQVIEQTKGHNNLIQGQMVSSGEIVFMGGDKATYPISDEWVKKEINKLKVDIEKKTTLLKKLTEISDKEKI